MVALTVAVTWGNVIATALENITRPIADAAGIQGSDAGVNVIANSIGVCVAGACAAAIADDVELIAVAVAITRGDVVASTVEDSAGTVADAASIECANAGVDIVADSISIVVCCATSSAIADGIQCGAAPVVIGGLDIVIAGR